ncbi:MAG: transcriptional repressor [Coriobacteriales bacterium]
MERRNTRQRQLVLEAVRSRCDHPTAEQIYQDVAAQDPKISRGTVYRNLSVLAQSGELSEVETPSASRFDLRQERHHHLVCVSCGAVVDAPVEYQEQLDSLAAAGSGFTVTGHHTIFQGLCPDCARSAGRA